MLSRKHPRLHILVTLVVVGLVAAACGDDDTSTVDSTSTTATVDIDDPSGTTASSVGDQPGTSAPPPTEAPTTTETESEPALVGAASPIDAVHGYVTALSKSDYSTAWSLLHPRSRDDFEGGYDGFEGETGLVEGTGSHGRADRIGG